MGNNDFYSGSGSSSPFYGSSSVITTEANMRQELENTLDGSYPEIAKGTTGLIRRMRRTNDNKLIQCPCVNDLTHEADKDIFCPLCLGESYLWDEEYISYYKTLEGSDTVQVSVKIGQEPGLIKAHIVVFYMRYSSQVTQDDKIIEIQRDNAGDVISPVERTAVYRISDVWPYYADNGKLEYFKLFTGKDLVKHLNAPSVDGS